jgi:hypothetical protein
MDLEAGFALYNNSSVKNRSTGAVTSGSGFGDILLGSKVNLFGNEGARQALALLPFVKIPTASTNIGNGVTEFTLNAPYTINLDTLWSLTIEPAFGALKNTNNADLHGDYSFLIFRRSANNTTLYDRSFPAVANIAECAAGYRRVCWP